MAFRAIGAEVELSNAERSPRSGVGPALHIALTVYPWVFRVFFWVFLANLLVLLPMLIFKRVRRAGGLCIFLSSWVFGFNCWIFSFLVTYETLGPPWLIVGLAFAGVGVVPLAVVGTLVRHNWMQMVDLAFTIVVTFGARLLGLRMMVKADTENQPESE